MDARHTKPGGYVEFNDLDLYWTSPDGSLTEDHTVYKFNRQFIKTCIEQGIDPCPGEKLAGYLKDAGFVDVVEQKFPMPVGTWPADKHLVSSSASIIEFMMLSLVKKEVGAWNYLQVTEGLEAFLTALFTRNLGYSKEEVDVICAKIRLEMKDSKLHGMFHT